MGCFWPSLLVLSVLHCSNLEFLLLIEMAQKIASKRTYYYHWEAHWGWYTSHKLHSNGTNGSRFTHQTLSLSLRKRGWLTRLVINRGSYPEQLYPLSSFDHKILLLHGDNKYTLGDNYWEISEFRVQYSLRLTITIQLSCFVYGHNLCYKTTKISLKCMVVMAIARNYFYNVMSTIHDIVPYVIR